MNSSHEIIPPECVMYYLLGGKLPSSAAEAKAVLIFLIIINIVTSLFAAAFNSLVIMAVRTKTRLRTNKSNILLACLAVTDLAVGVIVQPMFIAVLITVVLGETTRASCALQAATQLMSSVLCDTSLIHLTLISGERYLAMKHAYAYATGLVTEGRLLVASGLAWFFSLIMHIPLFVDRSVFIPINNTFIGLSLAVIIFCHLTVYREVRRHQKELSTQQVTEEARQKFLKDKKGFKLSATIVAVLVLCCIPIITVRIVLENHRSITSIKANFVALSLSVSIAIFNSFVNPLIYAIRTREFRVAFIEITCRTANVAEAEEIEMRVFGSPNAVVRLDAGQQQEEDQQNEGQQNTNKSNNDVFLRRENHIEQLNYNSVSSIVLRRHSI